MEEQNQKESLRSKFGRFHDKHYKKLLLIPIIIFLLSLIYIGFFYFQTGDFIKKDISLTGGTSVTLFSDVNPKILEQDLSGKLEEITTREIYDILTRERKAVIIETRSDGDETKKILEEYLGYELNEENSSFEFTGSKLSESFYKQLLVAIISALFLMSIVVFIIFRTFVPSLAVIISAIADILMTLAVVDLIGMKISSAGIVAFLMLIGYSVDTDILLTNRVLKRYEGNLNEKLYGSFKTGMTMTLTSIVAVISVLIIVGPFSIVLNQIFTILAIGLGFDILNTWITNTSILKWYVNKK